MMIYILEFDRPLHHARYYIGWTKDEYTLPARLKHHQNGQGAAITRAAAQQGISWRLVWTMEGDKHIERQLKRQKNTPRLVKRFLQDHK
jgi:predicted GIY-YIG superfamily endonuclease